MKVIRKKLMNGLKTVIIEMPESEAVSTSFFVGAGGRYENTETSGISHFLEHMAFKGTKKYPSAEIYANLIESVGGHQNAWTDMDHTNFYNVVPREHRKIGFEAIFEQINNPLIKDEDIKKERGVITEEINMRNDNPMILVWDKLGGILWPNQPIGSDLIGPKENIRSFAKEDFLRYRNLYYHPENMALAVAGGIKEGEITPDLENFFGAISPGKKIEPEEAYDDQKASRTESIYKETDQANLILAYKTFSFSDPRKITLDLLSTILGAGMGSILFREVREKRGLAYAVDVRPEYYAETGFVAAYAGLNKDKVESAAKTIKRELYKTKDKPIRVEDIKRGKEYLKGYYKIQFETASSYSNWFGKRELLYPDNPEPKEIIAQIEAVTEKDLRQVADAVFSTDRENLLVVGPYKNKDKFEQAIRFS